MAWSVDNSGTQTAVIGTEHILDQPTAAATYQFYVDKSALVGGEIVELRVYKKVDGTNYQQMWKGSFILDMNPAVASPPTATAGNQLKFTLKQTTGTGRAFPWLVEKI